jgi:hypothetical protein
VCHSSGAASRYGARARLALKTFRHAYVYVDGLYWWLPFAAQAAIEYTMKNVDAAKEALTDMPPRTEEELDPVGRGRPGLSASTWRHARRASRSEGMACG